MAKVCKEDLLWERLIIFHLYIERVVYIHFTILVAGYHFPYGGFYDGSLMIGMRSISEEK